MVQPAYAEVRELYLYNNHTKETARIAFKRNGKYIQKGLKDLNRFLRDWRRNEPTKMDPRLFDLVWEVYTEVGATKPIHVVSAYRSPATNAMLRSRSRGVAKKSQHTLGKAMDFFIPGVPLSKLRAAGLRMHIGGVGYYPKSGSPFVHMDTGRVRHWPRMTRKQLASVFPKGDTTHVPTDGRPMKNAKLAAAAIKKRGSDVVSLEKKRRGIGNLFASNSSSSSSEPKRVRQTSSQTAVARNKAAPAAAKSEPEVEQKPEETFPPLVLASAPEPRSYNLRPERLVAAAPSRRPELSIAKDVSPFAVADAQSTNDEAIIGVTAFAPEARAQSAADRLLRNQTLPKTTGIPEALLNEAVASLNEGEAAGAPEIETAEITVAAVAPSTGELTLKADDPIAQALKSLEQNRPADRVMVAFFAGEKSTSPAFSSENLDRLRQMAIAAQNQDMPRDPQELPDREPVTLPVRDPNRIVAMAFAVSQQTHLPKIGAYIGN